MDTQSRTVLYTMTLVVRLPSLTSSSFDMQINPGLTNTSKERALPLSKPYSAKDMKSHTDLSIGSLQHQSTSGLGFQGKPRSPGLGEGPSRPRLREEDSEAVR